MRRFGPSVGDVDPWTGRSPRPRPASPPGRLRSRQLPASLRAHPPAAIAATITPASSHLRLPCIAASYALIGDEESGRRGPRRRGRSRARRRCAPCRRPAAAEASCMAGTTKRATRVDVTSPPSDHDRHRVDDLQSGARSRHEQGTSEDEHGDRRAHVAGIRSTAARRRAPARTPRRRLRHVLGTADEHDPVPGCQSVQAEEGDDGAEGRSGRCRSRRNDAAEQLPWRAGDEERRGHPPTPQAHGSAGRRRPRPRARARMNPSRDDVSTSKSAQDLSVVVEWEAHRPDARLAGRPRPPPARDRVRPGRRPCTSETSACSITVGLGRSRGRQRRRRAAPSRRPGSRSPAARPW